MSFAETIMAETSMKCSSPEWNWNAILGRSQRSNWDIWLKENIWSLEQKKNIEEKNMLYTSKEKYAHIAEKNKAIELLKEKLDLSIL